MLHRLPALTLTFLLALAAEGMPLRQKTTRKLPRRAEVAVADTPKCDTLTASTGMITLSGYEKPLRSRRESLFVTNHTPDHVCGVVLDLSYSDLSGRELHKRRVTVSTDLPSGSTRHISFTAWDTQNAFYYRLSPVPVRAQGSPYDVACQCVAIITRAEPDTTPAPDESTD